MEGNENSIGDEEENREIGDGFKKPQILVGKIGKLSRKIVSIVDKKPSQISAHQNEPQESPVLEKLIPLPYTEPKWSAEPPKESQYKLEVLKSGLIIETIDLTNKPFFVFGRLETCDVVMAHPTISRYHMVLQYKEEPSEEHPCGFYLFDLDSTHGTFLNKNRLKPKHYVRMMVGHMFKLGSSTRNFLLQGPEEDQEEESELSVTEMKQLKNEELEERKRRAVEALQERERIRLEEERKAEEAGISWGLGDDAEEETDLSENPYATTNNEELYLDDPKKTLRGFFEREGISFDYECEQRGVGQFMCRVELPIDDAAGRPIIAEVLHKGKKKEAVVQCALEACRIIDRHGLLRQARHESRKRKEKDWQSEDFYDSDDDTFLDRTGKVEEKRKRRIARFGGGGDGDERANDEVVTYDGLIEKATAIRRQIEEIEGKLAVTRRKLKADQDPTANGDVDDLDAYMASLTKGGGTMSQKADISNMKLEIQRLRTELAKVDRLSEIARPTSLPELIRPPAPKVQTRKASATHGKRSRPAGGLETAVETARADNGFVEEVESDEDDARVGLETVGGEGLETVGGEKPESARVFGPMRPPEDYVIPESYFEQESDRDLPEMADENDE